MKSLMMRFRLLLTTFWALTLRASMPLVRFLTFEQLAHRFKCLLSWARPAKIKRRPWMQQLITPSQLALRKLGFIFILLLCLLISTSIRRLSVVLLINFGSTWGFDFIYIVPLHWAVFAWLDQPYRARIDECNALSHWLDYLLFVGRKQFMPDCALWLIKLEHNCSPSQAISPTNSLIFMSNLIGISVFPF